MSSENNRPVDPAKEDAVPAAVTPAAAMGSTSPAPADGQARMPGNAEVATTGSAQAGTANVQEAIPANGGGNVPTAGVRKKRRAFWPTLLIIALVGGVGFFTFWDRLRPHERISVNFTDVHGLHVGSPLEHDGDQIGEIVAIERSNDLSKRKVTIELIDDAQIKDRLRRKGNEFFVSRFASDRMQLKGVTRVIRGPSVVVRLGNPEGEYKADFDGSESMPPDSRIVWNSLRTTVTFPNVQGLVEGALVMDRGQEVGVVEKVSRDGGSDFIKVRLAFFTTDMGTCPYVHAGTRYFINKAKLSTRGVEGDASTVLFGAHVVAVPDPCYPAGKVTELFSGDENSPPEHLPRTGEKQVVLESALWVPPDTPIAYRGDQVGYVLRVQQASDSNSFYVVARIYPAAVPQVCEKTVFFLQAKLKAQLFKSHGIFSWEGPKLEIPDPQLLLRPAIEFRTPPNSGKHTEFDLAIKPSFTLYAEPKDEWLKWTSSIPVDEPASGQQQPLVKFPQPMSAKYHWRQPWRPLVSWHKYEGLVLPVARGVIGPVELLKPSIAESSTTKATFELGGSGRSREGAAFVDLGGGLCYMKLDLGANQERCPTDQLAAVDMQHAVDCWIVVDQDQPKAIAAAKLTPSGNGWSVRADSGFQSNWHGAAVVCRDRTSPAYGKVIGLLLVGEKARSATVALFPANVAQQLV